MSFDQTIFDLAATQTEVDLTTFGRKTGNASRRTIWVTPREGRLFIRSGRGLGRDWPQNVLANGRAILHLAGHDVPVRAVHVTDPDAARAVSAAIQGKYPQAAGPSVAGGLPTPGEQATFELLPA